MDRRAHLTRLANERFDLIIVGGGITGACLAYDATTRGLKTALVEKQDFGHATSASSSKLLHGGIRFLQQLRIDKVRESSFERVYFQNLAPHLCRYVPFVIPTFPSLKKGKAFLGAGAIAYSLIGAGQNARALHPQTRVPRPRIVGREELDRLVPWLSADWPATGGLVLPESHMQSSERMTLSLVKAAADEGCAVCNYVEATKVLQRNGATAGLTVSADNEEFSVDADAVANCAGPWLSNVEGRAMESRSNTITSFSRGSHLVVQGLDLDCALALPTSQKIQGMADRGGRHVFLIPWRGHALLGTSYAPHDANLDRVTATRSDRAQLLDAVNGALGRPLLDESNVVYSYSGIYPLTATKVERDVYQGASDYIVTDHGSQGGPKRFFSLFGAKYTTARKLAEVACNAIAVQTKAKTGPCTTRSTTLPGADIADADTFVKALQKTPGLSVDEHTADHLYTNYGKSASAILKLALENSKLEERLSDTRPNIAAEAVFSARNEMVQHLGDFVFRRTGLGTIGNPGRAAIERAARLLARELSWEDDFTDREVENVCTQLRTAVPDA